MSCSMPFIFSIKDSRRFTCRDWLLESVVVIYFCNTSPRTIPESSFDCFTA